MNNNSPFNLTIVLPPNRQYYVSYFYPYDCNNSIYANMCKYRSNVTTVLEEGWHTADIYNEFWKDNPTRGEPIRGNIYKVPFTFEYDVILHTLACTYFIFSWYEGDELKYFVYAMNKNNALGGDRSYGHGELLAPNLLTDEDGSLLVYIGFLTDYATYVYAPGRKIYNHVLGVDEALIQASKTDKCIFKGSDYRDTYYNNFPYEVLVNGYHVFHCPSGIIYGNYNLEDGYNEGYKVPELVGAIIKEQFGNPNWSPYIDDKGTSKDYVIIYRFKFTRTGDSDPNRTIFRVLKFRGEDSIYSSITIYGDLWIDSETKELKIQSYLFTPYLRVLKQLPDDALYSWHELALTFGDPYGYIKGIYFDGEYIDIVEIAGRGAYSSFILQHVESYPKASIDPSLYSSNIEYFDRIMSKDKTMLVDYIGIHRNTELEPYVMKDNHFDYYEPVLPDVPEPKPEEEKDLTKYLKNNYYVSNRQEAGTLEYSIDPTKITDIVYVPFITIQEVKNFIRHNELIEGSFFGDINRTDLKFPREMGNLEWVIHALQLNPRIKYTPDSLAAFLHQYDEENTYTTPKVGVYLVVDEDLSTIFDELTQIFNPTFKHVGLLLLEDTSTI